MTARVVSKPAVTFSNASISSRWLPRKAKTSYFNCSARLNSIRVSTNEPYSSSASSQMTRLCFATQSRKSASSTFETGPCDAVTVERLILPPSEPTPAQPLQGLSRRLPLPRRRFEFPDSELLLTLGASRCQYLDSS